MVRKTVYATIWLLFCQIGFALPTSTFLLDWWPNPNHIPLFVAQEKKLFEKRGFSLEILKINDAPDVVSYIVTKRADVGLYYMPQSFVAAEKVPLRMLAPYIDVPLQGFLMREECVQPKTVGGFPCALFSHFVDHLETKPTMIFLHGDLAFNLHARTVDAVFGVYKNIEVHQLEAQGIKTKFISPEDLGIPSFSELVLVVHKDFTNGENLLDALRESVAFCRANPEEAFAIYAKANPDKTRSVLEWEKKAWQETLPLLSTTLRFDQKQTELFFEWLQKRKVVSPTLELKDCFIP